MNRVALAALAALSVVGCAGEYAYVEPDPVPVSVAPPPPRYEVARACGGGSWVGGHWAWRNPGWVWRGGHCVRSRPGYIWVAPRYNGGVYYRGHFGRGPAGGYVPPPAPSYR